VIPVLRTSRGEIQTDSERRASDKHAGLALNRFFSPKVAMLIISEAAVPAAATRVAGHTGADRVAAHTRGAHPVDIQAGGRSTPGADNRGGICDPTGPDASQVGTPRKRPK